MANDVIFKKGRGGLGRPLAGADHISGMLFYTNGLPSGFSATDRIKPIYSVQDAEDLGINDKGTDADAYAVIIEFFTNGSVGDSMKITVDGIDSVNPTDAKREQTVLCDFKLSAADVVNVDIMGENVAKKINETTYIHGYNAEVDAAQFAVFAPKNQGIFLNTGGAAFTITTDGTVTSTISEDQEGTASELAIQHYHISEFFRMQPKGKLYVGIYPTSDSTTFDSVTLMQDYAQGEIVQLGIYRKDTVYSNPQVSVLQDVLDILEQNHKVISSAILTAEISGTVDVAYLSSIKGLDSKNVTVCIGQDGDNKGFELFKATGKSIGCMGTALGAVALAKVNESIRWISKFNLASAEFDVIAMSNGQTYTSLSDGLVVGLDTYGYLFAKKEIGISGSYFSRPHTATAITSDYSFIHSNRVIDKAVKNLRTALLPSLSSPLKLDSSGKLSEDTVSYFESLCERALEVMQRDTEISVFDVAIDPSQVVLTNNELEVSVKIVPVGVADTIIVNIGYALSI